ncbi:hypothetical protein FMM56_01570 [Campylobacter sp. LR264d]|uniref:hypothetical protein n=1 Tax=Campylobacter sp. LR264d TaxID=2593544 RepID=UPI00123B8B07|nr:hypothetical protein [Campylobacter sp. LR264d]KAA6233991.1 hypothetical protein FMM56_01570 [Campylobacter sp. LR264d]
MIECGNTLELEEDLRYTRESLLKDKRFTEEEANKYGYIKNIQMANKIQIANIKYNGIYGNIKNSNDGWNFRDRGLIQLITKILQ